MCYDDVGYYYVIWWLCYAQPVGQLAKCHTKRHLELQDNAAGHMTFVGAADMLAGLVLVAIHMPICLLFY